MTVPRLDKLSTDQLLNELREGRERAAAASGGEAVAYHELQVYEIELEMQNRELRQAQAELERSRDRYAALYDFAPIGLLSLDARGVITEANITALSMFGKPHAHAVGVPLTHFIEGQFFKTVLDHIAQCRVEGQSMCEVAIAGAQPPCVVQSYTVRENAGDGRPRYRTALIDVTRRRTAEDALRRANDELERKVRLRTGELEAANRALLAQLDENARLHGELVRRMEDLAFADRVKDEFLAMLSHELRNPLAPMLNGIELLKVLTPMDARAERVHQMVGRQLRQLVRLVDDLLDVTRVTSGKVRLRKERLPLGHVVSMAIEGVRSLVDEGRHTLTVRLPSQPIWIDADESRVVQAMVNLLNNAAKYTEPGGRIEVTADVEGDEAVVRVRDSGTGIAADLLPRVFDLFTQGERTLERAKGGLGVGLTLVKRLIEMHGGRVEARSEGVGRGSEFTVRLPLAADASGIAADAAPFRGNAPECRRIRVLIVDDNADAAESAAMVLREWGHETAVAFDGEAAIATAEALRPDVVLLDIGLPRMDGHEVAKRLRALPTTAGAWIIAVTGYGHAEDRAAALVAGCNDHRVKPLGLDELREALRGAMAGNGPSGP